jgi:ubiquinone/menaquinone biosynthesis C-methylase UbiE
MEHGVIEGKKAREYESCIKDSEQSRIFDNFIISNIRKGKTISVCDFACGPGNNIELIKGKVGKTIGVDLSNEMIKICREKFSSEKKVRIILASITKTHLKPNQFDYITIRMGLHHVKNKKKVMTEAHRLLKPGGRLIIIDKYYLNLAELCYKALWKLIFQGNPTVFQEYLISKKRTETLLSDSRFKFIKKKTSPYYDKHVGIAFMCVLEKHKF